MGLTLDGHHRRVVDLRLGDLRNRNIRMQLLFDVAGGQVEEDALRH